MDDEKELELRQEIAKLQARNKELLEEAEKRRDARQREKLGKATCLTYYRSLGNEYTPDWQDEGPKAREAWCCAAESVVMGMTEDVGALALEVERLESQVAELDFDAGGVLASLKERDKKIAELEEAIAKVWDQVRPGIYMGVDYTPQMMAINGVVYPIMRRMRGHQPLTPTNVCPNMQEAPAPEETKKKGGVIWFEIDRLADFIIKTFPHEIGKGNLRDGESAVDVAIRLMGRLIAPPTAQWEQGVTTIEKLSKDVESLTRELKTARDLRDKYQDIVHEVCRALDWNPTGRRVEVGEVLGLIKGKLKALADLGEACKNANAALSKANTEHRRLTKQIEDLQKDNEGYRHRVSEAVAYGEKFVSAIIQVAEALGMPPGQAIVLADDILPLLKTKLKALDECVKVRQMAEAEAMKLRNNVSRLQQEANAAEAQRKEAVIAREAAKEAMLNEVVKEQLRQAEAASKELHRVLDEKRKALDDLAAKRDAALANVTALQGDIGTFQQDNARLLSEGAILHQRSAKRMLLLRRALKALAHLGEKHDYDWNADPEEITLVIGDLEAHAAEVAKESLISTKELADIIRWEQESRKAKGEALQEEFKKADWVKRMEMVQNDLARKLGKDVDELNQKLSERNAECTGLRGEVSRLKAELQKAVAWNKTIDSQNLKSMKAKFVSVVSHLRDLVGRAADIISQITPVPGSEPFNWDNVDARDAVKGLLEALRIAHGWRTEEEMEAEAQKIRDAEAKAADAEVGRLMIPGHPTGGF